MRSIFFKLFVSFAVTVLLSGVVSGLVTYSLSHRSILSYRAQFHKQLNANIAHSIALMGQAAYAIYDSSGSKGLEEYLQDIQHSMRTELFLLIGDTSLPEGKELPGAAADLVRTVRSQGSAPPLEESGRLIAVSRKLSPQGTPYVVVGLHQLGPPPEFPKIKPPANMVGLSPLHPGRGWGEGSFPFWDAMPTFDSLSWS